jgi:hypothetical protein
VQLISLGFLNIMGTALLVSGFLAAIATAGVWALRRGQTDIWSTFLAVFAFSVLGFVTGKVMGNSREAAVGTIVPAVLTLLGGIAIYVIGAKGTRVQGPVSAMVLCFAVCLFAGSHFGAQLRYEYEAFITDPMRIARHDLLREETRQATELKRLLNYVELLKFQRSFIEKEKVDLSRFVSTLEKPPNEKAGTEPVEKK